MTGKPSEKEQEYFVNEELARLRRLREASRERKAVEERERQKELHWLHCPKCGDGMEVTHLGEVEVEVCPACGGLFLDAGELDKVLEERHQGGFSRALGSLRGLFRE